MSDLAAASNPKTSAPESSADAVKQGIDAIRETGGGTAITPADKIGNPTPADKDTRGVVEHATDMIHNMYSQLATNYKDFGKEVADNWGIGKKKKTGGKLSTKAAKAQDVGGQKGAPAEKQSGQAGSEEALRKGKEKTAARTMKSIREGRLAISLRPHASTGSGSSYSPAAYNPGTSTSSSSKGSGPSMVKSRSKRRSLGDIGGFKKKSK